MQSKKGINFTLSDALSNGENSLGVMQGHLTDIQLPPWLRLMEKKRNSNLTSALHDGNVNLQTVIDQFSAQAKNKRMKCAEITLFYLSQAHPREDLPLHFTLPLDDIRVLHLCLSAAFRTQIVQLCVKYLGDEPYKFWPFHTSIKYW